MIGVQPTAHCLRKALRTLLAIDARGEARSRSVHGLAYETVTTPENPTLLPMPIALDERLRIDEKVSPVAVPEVLKGTLQSKALEGGGVK